jgi:hypothetical protein
MEIINPIIKLIDSQDWDLSDVVYSTSSIVGIHLTIGERGSPSGDLFQMEIINSFWIRENLLDGCWGWGRARMLMDELSVASIETKISSLIASSGPYRSWQDFAKVMFPFLRWEFENMKYPPFPIMN